jgi:hypothetical protein
VNKVNVVTVRNDIFIIRVIWFLFVIWFKLPN